MLSGLFIDAKNRRIEPVTIRGLEDLQRYVEGYIEPAPIPNGQGGLRTDMVVYVDEEGLLKSRNYGFKVGESQPFVGNGIALGPGDNEGNETDLPPVRGMELLTLIRFIMFEPAGG